MTKFYVMLDDLYVASSPKKFNMQKDACRSYLTDKIEKARAFDTEFQALKCAGPSPEYRVVCK